LDFPDPSTYSLGKLYSNRFYQKVHRLLAAEGALAVQSTSPQLARSAFWCVVTTIESVGLEAYPYHAFLPSFGDWGYVLAMRGERPAPRRLPVGLKYLDEARLEALFQFPLDMTRIHTVVNRLGTQALVEYYLDEWGQLH
jgi:spermidine synthase